MGMFILILLLTFYKHSLASENGNITTKTTNADQKLSPDIFRQLLNQETIIRLTLTKNVQALMRDMLTMKQGLLSTEAELKDVKKEVDDLRKENALLNKELSEHKKTFTEVNKNFLKVNENFERVRKNTFYITKNHRRFKVQVEKNAEYFENKTTSSLADLKTEMRFTSLTLLNLEKHTKEVEKSMPILMDDRLRVISNSVNKTIGNLSMDALKLYMTEEVNKAVNEVKVNFLETQNQQLKLSNSVSALEMFRMNVSSIIAEKFQQLCSASTPIEEKTLFPSDITKRMKEISDASKINKQIISGIQRNGYSRNFRGCHYRDRCRRRRIGRVDLKRRNSRETLPELLKSCGKNSAEIGRRQGIGAPVGFTAGITSDSSYWSGTSLIFPKVISNIGGGYNPSNGIFTTPVDGDFVFYVAIVSYSSNYMEVSITVNGNGKVAAKPMNGNYESGSNLLVIRLRKDDKVSVQRTGGSGYESDPTPLMTFSGFKI